MFEPTEDTKTATAVDAKIQSTPTTKELKRQAEECRKERKELIADWTDSKEMHRGMPFADASDTDRIPVNKDWPRVKARVSSLFGQMPEVRCLPKNKAYADAVPVFAKELNDTLKRADTDEAVFQALVDNTATAGIGVVMVNYQVLSDTVQQPVIDMSTVPPEQAAMLMQSGQEIPMEDVPVDTDKLFSVTRLSPSDLLWPIAFTGFNFDKADWLGRSGEMGWSEAQNEFQLTDDQKEKVLGDGKEAEQTLKQDDPTQLSAQADRVEYDEIFYWAYRFDPKEKYFKKIRRIVFVKGVTDPVIHEDWAGQEFHQESGKYVGACRFPLRVLKINYVSDDAIPPSESAIGRPQVLELIDFRTDQHLARKRDVTQMWGNTNKLDPETLVQLQQGTFKGIIPTNGRGEDALGMVGRSHYAPENTMFERNINHDLDEVWQSGANQNGSFATGERSASEAKIVQGNFDMRNGLDRSMVAKFVQSIAEVMAGFLALYGDFELSTPEELQRMDSVWDRKTIANEFVFEILPDSMVRLDAHQQIELRMNILNMVGKSGFINPAPMIAKILALAGEDPAESLTQPNPPPVAPLNISIRSAEDVHDPIMLALLMKTDQAPSKEDIQAAQALLASLVVPLGAAPVDPATTIPQAPTAPPDSATSPEGMTVLDKVNKRSDYGS